MKNKIAIAAHVNHHSCGLGESIAEILATAGHEVKLHDAAQIKAPEPEIVFPIINTREPYPIDKERWISRRERRAQERKDRKK